VEARRRTWFDDRGLVIASGTTERRLPFYAGAMHYWRVERARWPACLSAMHELGFTIVETYVPWRVHESEPGVHDWTGNLDLAAFLDAAAAAGLAVVLRPGPHVNAELTSFGMPDHVLDEPELQARTAHGTPVWIPTPPRAWPAPSYASAKFHERVCDWYAAVAEVVRPYLSPDGPVVAFGVDNEAQMFFRLGAFDHDYHPDAIEWWHESSGLEGDPPRAWDPAQAARCVEWVRFKDHYLSRSLGDFARMLDDLLGGVARFHNLPPGHHGLYDLRGIQAAIGGPVGIDAYTPRAEFAELRRRGSACVANARPVPLALEVGVGFFPWFPPLDAGDDATRERDHLLSLLAVGLRGFNLFMAVERDRYYGAAIAKDGAIERHATWIRTLLGTLAEVDWPGLRRATPIALIDCRADARFGHASCAIDPMTPVLSEVLGLGPGGHAELAMDDGALAARRWQTAIVRALELAQVPYAIVDEAAPEAELATYRAVIVPTIDRIDRGLLQRIRTLAEARHTVVVIGPGTPSRDELDQVIADPGLPRRIGRIRAGSLEDLPGLAADLAGLAGDLPEAWQIERPDEVRAMAHADGNGIARVIFVVSDAGKPTSAILLADDRAKALRDPFTGEHVKVVAGKLAIAMPPRGVRMFVVE